MILLLFITINVQVILTYFYKNIVVTIKKYYGE